MLAAAGYNFSLLLRWFEELLRALSLILCRAVLALRLIYPGASKLSSRPTKQPYAIAMKDCAPFGIAGIWENWKEPAWGEWIRTFAITTTNSNELVADIHDRMPVILAPGDYARWLGDEPDPRELMRPFRLT